jgi:membrane fusion protein (multidrug efflux system)
MVAVVGSDNKADIRPVKVGERVDNLWVILEGLKPGERVVVEGIQKVRPGMTVTTKAFEEAPAKPESAAKPEAKPEAKAEAKPETKAETPSKSAEPAKAEKR